MQIRPGRKSNQNLVSSFHNSSGICGAYLAVHNGNKFIPVYVTENMVGHKLGNLRQPVLSGDTVVQTRLINQQRNSWEE